MGTAPALVLGRTSTETVVLHNDACCGSSIILLSGDIVQARHYFASRLWPQLDTNHVIAQLADNKAGWGYRRQIEDIAMLAMSGNAIPVFFIASGEIASYIDNEYSVTARLTFKSDGDLVIQQHNATYHVQA